MNFNNETIPDFEKIVEKLHPVLQEVEGFRRRKWKKIFFVALLLLGVIAIFYKIDRTYFFHKEYVIVTIAVYLCAIVLFGVIWVQSEKVGDEYKRLIISAFVKNMLKKGKFTPDKGISEKDFIHSGLFNKPDKYYSEDLITGQIGEINIAFSEVHAQEQVTKDNFKRTQHKYYRDIFNGFIFIADFPKELKNSIEIRRYEIYASTKNKVYLEDPIFAKLFNTYCTDQIEVRCILTPSMMEKIRKLEKKIRNKQIVISFHDSQILIAISDKTNHYEADIWQSIFNTKRLRREYDTIKGFAEIVEDLSLNQQVWKNSFNS